MAEFADAAARLAGQAGVLFGWRPDEFWAATPAELGALVGALTVPGGEPVMAADLADLQRMFPDG